MAHPEATLLSLNFPQIFIQLRKNQRYKIRLNVDLSGPLPIANGVKQSCVLAPTLFSISFCIMLKQPTDDLEDDDGVYAKRRLDDSLFNLRRLQAHTKNHMKQVSLPIISYLAYVSGLFVLKVILRKTEVPD